MVVNEAQDEAVQLVVCGMRWPVRLEEPEQSLDFSRQHGPPRDEGVWGPCSTTNALKLPANQLRGGDSLVQVVVEGLQERSRLKMTEELRRFIMVDNHGVKVGDLEKTFGSTLGGGALTRTFQKQRFLKERMS